MPKSLVEKIAEACRGVDHVLKQGDNGEYAYLRILDISNALRERLFAAGVIIVPSDEWHEFSHWDSTEVPGRRWTQVQVRTVFKVTDGIDNFSVSSYGYARDLDGKCIAIAQTAALKSFLKRLALIFGDYDDPEVREESIADLRPDLQRKIDEQTCITRTEVRALYSAIKNGGRSLEDLQAVLRDEYHVNDPHLIQKQDFTTLMAWALKPLAAQPE